MENVEKIIVHRLSPYAFLPTKGSAGSAGYDLYSAYACKVPARGRALVMTDIQVIRNFKKGSCLAFAFMVNFSVLLCYQLGINFFFF